jgi:hypothetical protein
MGTDCTSTFDIAFKRPGSLTEAVKRGRWTIKAVVMAGTSKTYDMGFYCSGAWVAAFVELGNFCHSIAQLTTHKRVGEAREIQKTHIQYDFGRYEAGR